MKFLEFVNRKRKTVSGEFEEACLLNIYFCSISTVNDTCFRTLDLEQRTNASIDIFVISLKKKALGPDSISHPMLRNTRYNLFSVIFAF